MKNIGTGTGCSNADIGAGVPGSQDFFDRLENLIGSVHTTEPDLRVVVYDMGLTRAQRRQVPASTLCLLLPPLPCVYCLLLCECASLY